jgi:nicotinic acetylcholine receptor
MDLTEFSQSHEWDIMAVPAVRSVVKHPHSNEFYPDLTFNMTLKRKTLFYTCNLIIPCVSISMLTVLTFYLPSECSEKISHNINVLLSLTVFILLLNELIPATSLVIPLIAKYLLFSFILITLSNLITVCVLNLHFRSSNTHKMPKWARHAFLNVLPKLLLMKRPPVTSSLSASYYMKEFARVFLKRKQSEFNSNDIEDEEEEEGLLIEDPDYPFRKKSFRYRKTSSGVGSLFFRNKNELQYHLDKKKAVQAVDEIVMHLREDDELKRIRDEWRYLALVIDRLFFNLFTFTFLFATASIILYAPSLYDTKTPIDQLISKKFKR